VARGSDNAVMTVELIHALNAELRVVVVHKSKDETGPGTAAGTLMGPTDTVGLHSQTFTALKELVCFELEVEENVGDKIGGVLYRFLPSTWFDTAIAAP
jgi:hypothetical protein